MLFSWRAHPERRRLALNGGGISLHLVSGNLFTYEGKRNTVHAHIMKGRALAQVECTHRRMK